MKARLHPHWIGGRTGYVYSVICESQLLVERSRDPECDAARALVAKGITGELTLLDGKTGKPRTIIDIEGAARLTLEETRAHPASGSTKRGVSTHCPAPKTSRRQHDGQEEPVPGNTEATNVCLHCGGTGIRTMPDHSNSWQTRRTLDADRQRDNRDTGGSI